MQDKNKYRSVLFLLHSCNYIFAMWFDSFKCLFQVSGNHMETGYIVSCFFTVGFVFFFAVQKYDFEICSDFQSIHILFTYTTI